MHPIRLRWFAAALALCALAAPAFAAERSEVPEKYKWNLTDLFPDEAAWQKSLADLRRRVSGLEARKGHLGDSPAAFYEALSGMMDFARDYHCHRGSIFGLSARADQTAFRRPGPRVRDVSGLYLVGGSTQPGGGVPMVVLGGKLVARLVQRDRADGRWRA